MEYIIVFYKAMYMYKYNLDHLWPSYLLKNVLYHLFFFDSEQGVLYVFKKNIYAVGITFLIGTHNTSPA